MTICVPGNVTVEVFIEGSRKRYESPHRAEDYSQLQRHYFFAVFRDVPGFRAVSATGASAGAGAGSSDAGAATRASAGSGAEP